ncbi:hypothetical protein DI392_17895 [Vibrio albus]|jgi:hypothetical protein|uniref:Uncharacterized protein n=1 Tax=Vibrio albus TaxID=2200953 RepID=A0A2U3B5H4_9VIBR|nr:hypothetical protein [Vibrio albus]PWI32051.1 hypothetical protein DI392_17895 [Vibrio albus]
MRKIITFLLVVFSCNALALGGYESLSDTQKKVIGKVTDQLGIKDTDNAVKKKIFDSIEFAFNSDWNSYWLGLNELSASKYKDEQEKGFVELSFSTSKEGTLFFTFIYKPEVNQIILSKKQVRYSSKSVVLGTFEERKADKEHYKIIYEKDNYALLQTKGKVDYEYYHVGTDAGLVVYEMQSTIDL